MGTKFTIKKQITLDELGQYCDDGWDIQQIFLVGPPPEKMGGLDDDSLVDVLLRKVT